MSLKQTQRRALCPECNGEIVSSQGQKDVGNYVHWFRSLRCADCEYAIEEDGDETPNEIRTFLIKRDGLWGLKLNTQERASASYKVIRDMLELPLSDILKIKKEKTDIIYKGTKVECLHYQRRAFMCSLELECIELND